MRTRRVRFHATGLRPFTRVYPFFDGRDVSLYVRQDGKSYGQSLITDISGKVSGYYIIPNNSSLRFRTGERLFQLLDDAQGREDESTTTAEASYTARGTLNVRQRTILSTKYVQPPRIRISWRDPLAQSFLIDQEGGNFITSIDVWFNTKDQNVPVTLEIREMDNGYPSQTLVPGATKTLDPVDVNLSADGRSNVTKFTFDRPIYLQEGMEYCFVLMANSTKYNVWISRMGERVFGSTRTVAKQPFVGVMFKSQNNSTWTAAQNDDIKFNIYRAKFDTTKTATVKLVNDVVDAVNVEYNPILVKDTLTQGTVKCFNHGLYAGSRVLIEGAVGGLGVADASLNKVHTVISTPSADEFVIDVTDAATSDGYIGGDDLMVHKNYQYDVFVPNVNDLLITGTEIEYKLETTTGKSFGGSETAYQVNVEQDVIENNQNFDLADPMVVMSTDDETANRAGAKSLTVTATMKSTKDNISPVIDTDGLTATLVNNRINDPTNRGANPELLDETSAVGGNAMARYFTKPNGLDIAANSLKIFLDVSKQPGTDVKMFYKIAQSESDVLEADWIPVDPETEALETDSGEFTEQQYALDDIGSFTHYMIKVVMLSDSSSYIPMCDNLRAIALGT